jgi:hypothetical protein
MAADHIRLFGGEGLLAGYAPEAIIPPAMARGLPRREPVSALLTR